MNKKRSTLYRKSNIQYNQIKQSLHDMIQKHKANIIQKQEKFNQQTIKKGQISKGNTLRQSKRTSQKELNKTNRFKQRERMKFSDLKLLIQQGRLQQFQHQLQRQQLVIADYNLLLRELIKNKTKKIKPIFDALIKKGADVNFAHIGGNKKNNLMVACEEGTVESVELLCGHQNIDFDSEDSMKRTAPYYAIENKNKNDAEIFLNKVLTHAPHLINLPANNQTMLILAIKKQKPQLVRILLNHHAQPNYIISDSGNTPLHQALKLCKTKQTRANKEIVKLLIQYGADPQIKNKKNKNAYEFADKFPLQALISEFQIKTKPEKEPVKTQNQQTQLKKSEKQSRSSEQEKQKNEKASPVKQKRQLREKKQVKQVLQNNQSKQVIFKSNSEREISELIKRANVIYDSEVNRILPTDDKKLRQEQLISQDQDHDDILSQTSSEQQDQTQQPFRRTQEITKQLTIQIKNFQQKCDQIYHNTQKDFEKFYHKLCEIAYKQNLNVQLCGSFSTGLWIKNCDIDIILVPQEQFITEKNPNYIQAILDKFETLLKKQGSIKITNMIKNKVIRVPMLRLDIQFPHAHGKIRKVDITVFDRNHNGMAISHYICENIKIFPQLKPLFFTIKSLTYHFKLNDPKNGGIRTYALIIMIISFLQNERIKGFDILKISLGELLLRFFHFFGFEYQYGYGPAGDPRQQQISSKMQATMLLTIYDPLNHTNNLGKKARAFEMQAMFKAAYIALHTNIKQSKLEFMFGLKKVPIF